jgi:L-fuculose-phosphate aldolase
MKKCTIIICLALVFTNCGQNPNQQHDQLIEIGKRCYDRGLFWGTGGDISVRLPGTDRFIVKGTQHCVGDLEIGKISTVNLAGTHLSGPTPAHETPIHAGIYSQRDEVGAILHMHAPYATAWATVGDTIPAITQQSVSLLKNSAIIPYFPVGSQELVDSVVNAYKNPATKVVYMENHGVFVVGTDLFDLLYNAEKVENTARIAYYCVALGDPIPFKAVTVY